MMPSIGDIPLFCSLDSDVLQLYIYITGQWTLPAPF